MRGEYKFGIYLSFVGVGVLSLSDDAYKAGRRLRRVGFLFIYGGRRVPLMAGVVRFRFDFRIASEASLSVNTKVETGETSHVNLFIILFS